MIAITTDTSCAGTARASCSTRGREPSASSRSAGVSSAEITRICITHFHGDALPRLARHDPAELALDQSQLPIPVHYPAAGELYFRRLRSASAGQERIPVEVRPASGREVVHSDERFMLCCAPARASCRHARVAAQIARRPTNAAGSSRRVRHRRSGHRKVAGGRPPRGGRSRRCRSIEVKRIRAPARSWRW